MIRDLAIAFGAFVAGTLVAELLGAVNLGTALTFGTIAFMAAIVARIVLRGPQRDAGPAAPEQAAAPPARKPPPPPPRARRRKR